jgi:hypothetical protein
MVRSARGLSRRDRRRQQPSAAAAGKNNLCIIALPALFLRASVALTGIAAKVWEFRDKLARGRLKTARICPEEKPVNRAWAGGFVFAKALPATGIMAIGGWPEGLFTHQFRQFRVISATTQKCCSREMDD